MGTTQKAWISRKSLDGECRKVYNREVDAPQGRLSGMKGFDPLIGVIGSVQWLVNRPL